MEKHNGAAAGIDSPEVMKSVQNNSKRLASSAVSPRISSRTEVGSGAANNAAGAPVHLVEVTGTAKTYLNVEDIIRKNHVRTQSLGFVFASIGVIIFLSLSTFRPYSKIFFEI